MSKIFKSTEDQVLFLMPTYKSQEQMAEDIGKSVITVKRAMASLKAKRLINRTGRDGLTGNWMFTLTKAGERARDRVISAIPQRRNPVILTRSENDTYTRPSEGVIPTEKAQVSIISNSENPQLVAGETANSEGAPTRGADVIYTFISEDRDLTLEESYAMDTDEREVQLVEAGHGISLPNDSWTSRYWQDDEWLWKFLYQQPIANDYSERDDLIGWLEHVAPTSEVATAILSSIYDRDRILGLMDSFSNTRWVYMECSADHCGKRLPFHPYLLGRQCCREGYLQSERRHLKSLHDPDLCRYGHDLKAGRCEYGHEPAKKAA